MRVVLSPTGVWGVPGIPHSIRNDTPSVISTSGRNPLDAGGTLSIEGTDSTLVSGIPHFIRNDQYR